MYTRAVITQVITYESPITLDGFIDGMFTKCCPAIRRKTCCYQDGAICESEIDELRLFLVALNGLLCLPHHPSPYAYLANYTELPFVVFTPTRLGPGAANEP